MLRRCRNVIVGHAGARDKLRGVVDFLLGPAHVDGFPRQLARHVRLERNGGRPRRSCRPVAERNRSTCRRAAAPAHARSGRGGLVDGLRSQLLVKRDVPRHGVPRLYHLRLRVGGRALELVQMTVEAIRRVIHQPRVARRLRHCWGGRRHDRLRRAPPWVQFGARCARCARRCTDKIDNDTVSACL